MDRSYLADRLLPALVFAGAAGARAAGLVGDATRPTGGAGADWWLVRGLSLGGGVLACLFCALLAVLLLDRRPLRGGRAGPAGIGVGLAGTLLMNALLAQPVADHDWRVLIVGDGLMLAGLALAIWAAVSLGGCFGVAPEARGLVRAGAYRFVRHPMYLGEAIAGLGALLAVLAPWTVAVYAGFCVCQLARARLEERALTSVFPAYAAYRRRTPLLPRRSRENEQAALAARDHQHDQEDHDAQQQYGAATRPTPAAGAPEDHVVTSFGRPGR